jgi:membrane protease YdiL (CAAX protease family)
MFHNSNLAGMAILSLVAGLGEELLFRGLVQTAIADMIGEPTGLWIGLVVASVLFGLAHFLTVGYVLMAALMGGYLGWLWIASDNLFIPIAAHAVYDFLALVYVGKLRRKPDPSGSVFSFRLP